jgi:hypothetical protein
MLIYTVHSKVEFHHARCVYFYSTNCFAVGGHRFKVAFSEDAPWRNPHSCSTWCSLCHLVSLSTLYLTLHKTLKFWDLVTSNSRLVLDRVGYTFLLVGHESLLVCSAHKASQSPLTSTLLFSSSVITSAAPSLSSFLLLFWMFFFFFFFSLLLALYFCPPSKHKLRLSFYLSHFPSLFSCCKDGSIISSSKIPTLLSIPVIIVGPLPIIEVASVSIFPLLYCCPPPMSLLFLSFLGFLLTFLSFLAPCSPP